MQKFLALIAVAAILAGTAPLAQAGEDSSLSIGSTYFFDYFANLTDYPEHDDTPTRGFELNRVYLTIKKSWGDMMFRSTTDIDTKFGTGNLNVYSKYAYLQHSGLIDGAKVLIGQHSPATHGWIEKIWRYRSIATTMSDNNKWTQSATLGIGIQGKTMEKKLEYYLDFNNGNGYKDPVNKDGMGIASRLVLKPSQGVMVSGLLTANAGGGVFDDDSAENFAAPVALDEFDLYVEGVVGWEGDAGSAFVEYGMFTDKQDVNGALDESGAFGETTASGLSAFGRAKLTTGTYAIGRFDMVDPNTDVDDNGHNLLLFGLSHELHEGFHVQPSVRVVSFEGDADDEQELRVTFYGEL